MSIDVAIPTIDVPLPGQGAVFEPPAFSQEDRRWAHDRLGISPEPDHDLAWGGCYVTSIAMLFNAYLPEFTDPSRMNRSLIERDGFVNGGELVWAVAAKLAPLGMAFTFKPNREFSWARVDEELAAHRPVLVPVMGIRTHIVVIWDIRGSGKSTRYSVMDPQKGGAYTWTRDPSSHVGDNGGYEIRGLTIFSP